MFCLTFSWAYHFSFQGAFTFGSCVQPSISAASSNQNKGASPFGSTSCTPAAVSFDSHAPFGSTGTPAFGAPGQQPALPSFGSLQESKSNGFGTSPSFGGPSSSSFTSNSKGSTGSAFQFGDKNQSAGSSGSFAFGQNQDQNPSGFNFNATVTAVPNSSAQANQAAGKDHCISERLCVLLAKFAYCCYILQVYLVLVLDPQQTNDAFERFEEEDDIFVSMLSEKYKLALLYFMYFFFY